MSSPEPGPRNAVTDVPGVLVGHHQRTGDGWATGTTVVLAPPGTTGGVDCRGGAPGTRETDLLAPENLVSHVDAICLSGGSAYGLAAADGVMARLASHERGFPVGPAPHQVVPIVPAAVIFDLPASDWGNRPDATFGAAAHDAAGVDVAVGSVGAGTGALAGTLCGGVGTASVLVGQFTLGALAVVNSVGEVVDPATGVPWAADFELDDEFGLSWPYRPAVHIGASDPDGEPASRLNTVVGVVAVDATLTKAECRRLAMAGQDGLARAVRPAHSMFDGDTVFALATGARSLPDGVARAVELDRLCAAAADCFARAIVHGVLAATPRPTVPAYSTAWP